MVGVPFPFIHSFGCPDPRWSILSDFIKAKEVGAQGVEVHHKPFTRVTGYRVNPDVIVGFLRAVLTIENN